MFFAKLRNIWFQICMLCGHLSAEWVRETFSAAAATIESHLWNIVSFNFYVGIVQRGEIESERSQKCCSDFRAKFRATCVRSRLLMRKIIGCDSLLNMKRKRYITTEKWKMERQCLHVESLGCLSRATTLKPATSRHLRTLVEKLYAPSSF